MLWFFRKENARVHYEIRREPVGDDFELVITREDGRQQIEKFRDARAVVQRSQLLHDSLIASGWRPPDAAGELRPPAGPTRAVSTLTGPDVGPDGPTRASKRPSGP
jgi:hypothetical protein